MESYREFLDRISSFEKKELTLGDGDFSVSPSVALKVDRDNSFRRFYGDTVVFALDDSVKEHLARHVDRLYRAAPKCFCQRLVPQTFHVTLHDLSNSPNLCDVAEEVFRNELEMLERRDELRRLLSARIRVKGNYVFNMVGTSLVLGVYPASEADYERLMQLYSLVDGVKQLSYPLTPHVTLAYYNVDGFDAKSARALEKEVNRINAEKGIEFELGKLYYQKFVSMNDYIDVIDLTE